MPRSDTQIVILAGGQGTRFWPISRMDRPKQFLSISNSGESLIQSTARRVSALSSDKGLHVVTNVAHIPLIKEHIPQARIMVEPVGRNTAAAIGYAAVVLAKQIGGDPVCVFLPADHAVGDEARLRETLSEAIALAAEQDALVTVGVKPNAPNTAYGYIRKGTPVKGNAFKVQRFYEKPNLDRAKKYFEAGDYYWNSGMFVWRVSTILAALEEFMPDLYQGLLKISAALGTSSEDAVIAEVFNAFESTSIDFGVLEHAKNCVVVCGESFGWNDVGSWDAWAEHFTKDDQGNLVNGEAILIDSNDCVVYSDHRLIGLVGTQDLIVIDAGDALMVCPRERVQDVKLIVSELKKKGRTDLI